jgi:broad specificity phosphatase PhoE
MMVYLLTTPPNTLEAKGRVLGSYAAHWNSAARKQLHGMCEFLKGKGVTYVYGSDLDDEAVHIVASELQVPFSKEYGLRRFGVGRNHGGNADRVQEILEALIVKWEKNPTIPLKGNSRIPGGDSWRSLEKRLFPNVDRIVAKEKCAVIVTDARTATLIRYREPKALVMNGEAIKPGKIFVVKKETEN